MKNRRSLFLLAGIVGAVFTPVLAGAQSYSVLHPFTGKQDGGLPDAGVTLDKSGYIYGVTSFGGSSVDGGVIFKLDAAGVETVLHAFDFPSGAIPENEPLTLSGTTLYGSTASGGAGDDGVLFSIRTDGSDYTVLHSFDGKDGYLPTGALQLVPGHGVVGVTSHGGTAFTSSVTGEGVLFALTEYGLLRKLHDFNTDADGHEPNAVLGDGAGNIFGSTQEGGGTCVRKNGCGIVFRFNLNTAEYSVLYHFTGEQDGLGPMLGSIGPDGRLYGATTTGTGAAHYGTLFTLTPSTNGYSFQVLAYSSSKLGSFVSGPTLTFTRALVGVSSNGLYSYSNGVSYLLQSMVSSTTGDSPVGQPAVAPGGSVFGTTYGGGIAPCVSSGGVQIKDGCGVVYSYYFP